MLRSPCAAFSIPGAGVCTHASARLCLALCRPGDGVLVASDGLRPSVRAVSFHSRISRRWAAVCAMSAESCKKPLAPECRSRSSRANSQIPAHRSLSVYILSVCGDNSRSFVYAEHAIACPIGNRGLMAPKGQAPVARKVRSVKGVGLCCASGRHARGGSCAAWSRRHGEQLR
jgi:hypothetical protein